MVRIRRAPDDPGRDSVRPPRGPHDETRGDHETLGEARAPGRVPAFPAAGGGRAGRPPDRRPDLRGIGLPRVERRMGDPQEGPPGNEAGDPGPPAPPDPRGGPHVRPDRPGSPRPPDEGPP